MHLKLFVCAISIMTTSVIAADVSIYKWIDDNGIVHFSHSHPANKKATEVDVYVAYSPSPNISTVDTDNDEVAIKAAKKKELARTAENAKMFDVNCKSAQANKKILVNFKKILIQDENGEDKLLTGDEITERVELADKHIDIYCATVE